MLWILYYISNAEFLSRETHRNSIALSRVCFKQYCLLSEVFYILYYISMQDFCFDKPIGIALGCFDSVLSNITCFLVCVLDNMLNFCFNKPIEIALGCLDSVLSNIPLNMSLGGIHTLQVSYSNTNTSADWYLCNIPLVLHRFAIISCYSVGVQHNSVLFIIVTVL